MDKKLKEFVQHLEHDTNENADENIEDSLALVGSVVMFFNSLEKRLDSFICNIMSDRTDSVGLIVINKLQYAAKVDLFTRFCDEFHRAIGKTPPKYKDLNKNLAEVGRLRNLVVHADWENTDSEGYTYVRLKLSEKGMHQEYIQFSVESLEKIINQIFGVVRQLSEYWEEYSDELQSH